MVICGIGRAPVRSGWRREDGGAYPSPREPGKRVGRGVAAGIPRHPGVERPKISLDKSLS